MTNSNYTKVSEIQNVTEQLIAEISEVKVIVTEKLDGTSTRVGYQDGQQWCGGHNHILTIGEKHQYDGFGWGLFVAETKLADKIEKIAARYNGNLALYGEFCGPKIQANPYKLTEYTFYVFDIRSEHRWLNWDQMSEITQELGLSTPPVEIYKKQVTKEQLDQLFGTPSTLNPQMKLREGVVIKSFDESLRFSDGRRMILKYRVKSERKFKKRKPVSAATKKFQVLKSAVDEYLNEERVQKAISHLQEANSAINFRSVLDELEKDILKEADPKDKELFEADSKEYSKAISKLFGSNSVFRSFIK